MRQKQIKDTLPEIVEKFTSEVKGSGKFIQDIKFIFVPAKKEKEVEMNVYGELGIQGEYDKYRSRFLRVHRVSDLYVIMVYQTIILEENDIWDFVLFDLSYAYALYMHAKICEEFDCMCRCELVENELFIGVGLWTQFIGFYLSNKILASADRVFNRKTYTVFSFPKQFIGNLRYYACSKSSMGYFLSVIVDDELIRSGEYLKHEYFRKFDRLNKDVRRYVSLILNYMIEKTEGTLNVKQLRQQLRRLGHLFNELEYVTEEHAVEEKPFDDIEVD